MHRTKALLVMLSALLALCVGGLVGSASAAASAPGPYGRITSTFQHRDGTVTVTGYAYDRSRPSRSVTGCIAVGATCQRSLRANWPSPVFDKSRRITGAHAFKVQLATQRPGVTVQLRTYPGHPIGLDTARVVDPGARVVQLARRYVGRTRYVEGGATPSRGFDCSGYAAWVYRYARVATLPHNADAQRHVRHMRRITRSGARPGDLVFYLSGGSAYHVAIYAGHGRQYAAATPQDGIRYQSIWSTQVEFRTDWH